MRVIMAASSLEDLFLLAVFLFFTPRGAGNAAVVVAPASHKAIVCSQWAWRTPNCKEMSRSDAVRAGCGCAHMQLLYRCGTWERLVMGTVLYRPVDRQFILNGGCIPQPLLIGWN